MQDTEAEVFAKEEKQKKKERSQGDHSIELSHRTPFNPFGALCFLGNGFVMCRYSFVSLLGKLNHWENICLLGIMCIISPSLIILMTFSVCFMFGLVSFMC
ncbi:hypothetical protein HPP92_002162 [Vanilla planifolia]|uniref:Uncharacterized protein n=1 Tax=Vanilla planifolia TaxID=51239 RepID=A0A835VM41_VANPL|nr:hypothetical protein HPP92_002162 [Vanilla planifolia]